MVVDERAIIVQLRWVLWSKRARSRSTRYLQISRWLFGADSSIILEFIALRVKARGDGLFVFTLRAEATFSLHELACEK